MSKPLFEKDISIIIVEDEEGHAFLIEKNLRRAGVANKMVHLKTGQEAIDYLTGNPVRGMDPTDLDQSLILLDLHLPIYDGFQVLEKIRSLESIKHTPVLILSSTTRQQEIKRCYELGCSIFLNKPVDYSSFSDAIMQLGLLLKIVKVHT